MPLLTTNGQYYTESRTVNPPTNWRRLNGGSIIVRKMYAVRSVTTRRVKPVGLDLLFSGTSYTRNSWYLDNPIVSFGPSPVLAGTQYRGENSVMWLAPLAAVNYFQMVYPNITGTKLEMPSKLSPNELRNLIADQKADLLTNALEYKQTVSMFKETSQFLSKELSSHAKDVQKTIRRYNRVGWGIPGSALTRKLANLHLAYVFGVRPLVADMCGAFEVLVNSDPRRVFRNRKITGAPAQTEFREWVTSQSYQQNMRTSVVRQTTARYKYIVYGEMGPVTDWHQYARLGINPLATAWEVVPWSFAIDRFINIGDALQSMGALAGLTRAVAYEQLVVDLQSTLSHPLGQAVLKQKVRERALPSLSWGTPRYDNTFGANQVVTYTALLRQQLTKLSPLFK